MNPKPNHLAVLINVAFLKRLLLASVFSVAAAGSLANYLIYHFVDSDSIGLQKLLRRFDLGHEPSFPNFFSSLLIFVAATITLANGLKSSSAKYSWFLLSGILICLSIDESIMLHEMLDATFREIGWNKHAFFFPWTVAGVLFAGSVFLATKKVLTTTPPPIAIRMMAGGFVFLLGAVGVENVAAYIFELSGSEAEGVKTIAHWISQTFEELFEMLGMTIFIFAVSDNLIDSEKTVSLEVNSLS